MYIVFPNSNIQVDFVSLYVGSVGLIKPHIGTPSRENELDHHVT